MRRRSLLALLLVPLVLGASGCIPVFVDAVVDPTGRKAALRLSQREYTKFVRWGDVGAAAGFVHPEALEAFLATEKEFEGIRVTDFEIGEIVYIDGEDRAEVRVTYHAYSMKSLLETEIEEKQSWELVGTNQWRVRPELHGLVGQVTELR